MVAVGRMATTRHSISDPEAEYGISAMEELQENVGGYYREVDGCKLWCRPKAA